MLSHQLDHRPLLVEDMGFNLVDGRFDGGVLNQRFIGLGIEVGDAN